MGMKEKIANAERASWLTDGLTEAEVKTVVELAKISAIIEKYRIAEEMTQQEFAKFMGVSQAMVSKWESREYNFTIRSLNEICNKLKLDFNLSIETKPQISSYKIYKWDVENKKNKKANDKKVASSVPIKPELYEGEAIA